MSEVTRAEIKSSGAKKEKVDSKKQNTNLSQSISSPVEQILFLQRTIGNQAVGRLMKFGALQAKLRIGAPSDIYEQEADRVAEQVMRMPEPEVSKNTMVSGQAYETSIQRSCPKCTASRLQEEEEVLQPKEISGSNPEVAPELETGIDAIRDGGQPLPESEMAFFEPRFGYDFSQVRVHSDARAAGAAGAVNARAFTLGRNVVFGAGQYKPETGEGRSLLAHELVHTIQQGGCDLFSTRRSGIFPLLFAVSVPNFKTIQRKEGILKPIVTEENPLVRLINDQPDGLTTPLVNGIKITTTTDLDNAIPSQMSYTQGKTANSCNVSSPIDIFSQANIITASAPGPTGWTTAIPYNIITSVLKVTDKKCAAIKGNINVRMIASIGNSQYAALVRSAEGDHEAVLKSNHDNYLKPYHDYVNSAVGNGKTLQSCAQGLAASFRAKEVAAINSWASDWIKSIQKLDGPGGSHNDSADAKVIGNCAEILVTIKR